MRQETERLNEYNHRLKRDKTQEVRGKERQLSRVNHQLKENERVIANFKRQILELEGQLRQREQQCDDRSQVDSKTGIKLRWREGEKAPCGMDRWYDVVIGRNMVYYVEGYKIHAYNTTTSNWSLIPKCPIDSEFAVAVIDNTLTTIGGRDSDMKVTNKLFSLTGTGEGGEKSWTEEFPPMPTKRRCVSALCTGAVLIVVGGEKDKLFAVMKTVEVLDTSTRQWHTAAELPQPLYFSSMTVCGDRFYLLGGRGEDRKWTSSVYSCSVITVHQSIRSRIGRALSRSSATWTRVADLPVSGSTAVSLYGHLIAVGREASDDQPTSDVHRYDPSTNSWEVISHMATPRAQCFATVLPDNQLMVFGGWTKDNKTTDSVEFGASL